MTIQFAKRVVYGLDMRFDRVRVGTVAYGTSVKSTFLLNTDQSKEAVINALDYYYTNYGRTNTQEALRITRNDIFTSRNGDRSGVKNIVILLSDGGSNINPGNTVREAETLKRENVDIYSIAMGSADVAEMADISSDPDSEYLYEVRTLSEVDSTADRLLDKLCQ